MVTGFLDIGHVVKQVVAGSLDFGIIRVGCEMMPFTARFHIMLAIHLSPGLYFDSGCLALGYHFCALHHICACSSHHEALFFLHLRSLSLVLCCVLSWCAACAASCATFTAESRRSCSNSSHCSRPRMMLCLLWCSLCSSAASSTLSRTRAL